MHLAAVRHLHACTLYTVFVERHQIPFRCPVQLAGAIESEKQIFVLTTVAISGRVTDSTVFSFRGAPAVSMLPNSDALQPKNCIEALG